MVRGKSKFLGAFSVALLLGQLIPAASFAITPQSVRVPCTDGVGASSPDSDYSGPAEWGRRRCNKVKPELKQRLEERVAHVLAHYYEGRLVYFAPNNVGFCMASAIKRPVCELATPDQTKREGSVNFLGQSCGEKVRGNPAEDRPCFSKRPLPLDKNVCGPDRYAIGMGEINGIKKMIAEFGGSEDEHTRNHAAAWSALLNDTNRSTDHLMGVWNAYVNSGNEYCSFSSSGLNLKTCGKENAWISGFRVSALQVAHEQVRNEIESGTLKLVDFGGHRPCGEIAQSIEYALNGDPKRNRPGIRVTERRLREKYAKYKERATGENKETEVCLGDIDNQPDASRAIANAFAKSNEKDANTRYISQSACSITMARRAVQNAFLKLASCEVNERTRKLLYDNQVTAELFQRVKDRIATPCGNYAKGTVSFWDGCFEGCATNNFYKCYRGERRDISPGIEEVVAQFAREKFQYTHIVKPAKLKVVAPSDPSFRMPAGVTAGQPVPDSMIPNCGAALSIVPFFGRRKRASRMKAAARISQVIMVLAVVAMVFSGLGCSEDEPDIDTGPDGPPCPFSMSQQNSMTIEQAMQSAEAKTVCKANDKDCLSKLDYACAFMGDDPEDEGDEPNDEITVHESIEDIDVIDAKEGALVEKNTKEKDKTKKNLASSAATALTRHGGAKNKFGKLGKGTGWGDGKGGDNDKLGDGSAGGGGLGDANAGYKFGGLYGDGFGTGGGAALGEDGSGSGSGADKDKAESESANRGVASGREFGDGASGSGGPAGGTSEVDLSGGAGGDVKDIDGYFSKNKKLSLFEVINRRTAIWSADLDAKQRK